MALLAAACAGVLPATASAQPAPAEPPPTDAPPPAEWVEAEKLFAEGRAALTRPRDLAKACDILARSYALRQRGDTLLNLAECHRRQGKTATAWREFDEAIRYAVSVEFREAIDAAVSRRDELAPLLSELYVEVDQAALPPDAVVLLDGKKLPPLQWNARLFVDPGKHVVTATGGGYEPFEGSVVVEPKVRGAVIRVEPKKVPEAPPPPPVAPPPPKATPKPPPPPPEEAPIWPYVVGGAGVIAMAVAVVFVVDSAAAGSDLDEVCGAEERDGCPGDYDFESPRGREIRGFGLFVGLGVAGLAATTVGAIGWATTRPKSPDRVSLAPWASPDGAGVVVRGATF